MSQHQAFRRTAVDQQVAQKLETITLPAPTKSGSNPMTPTTRAIVNVHRRRARRRVAMAIDWATPKMVKPTRMKIVPLHENSGLSEISRIHTRAPTPSANPANGPAMSIGQTRVRRVGNSDRVSTASTRSVTLIQTTTEGLRVTGHSHISVG